VTVAAEVGKLGRELSLARVGVSEMAERPDDLLDAGRDRASGKPPVSARCVANGCLLDYPAGVLVPAPNPRRPIGCGEERFYLRSCQKLNQALSCRLLGYREHALNMRAVREFRKGERRSGLRSDEGCACAPIGARSSRTCRPPKSNGRKGVNIHLRIDPRRVLIVMTQNLTDLREGGSGTQQQGCAGTGTGAG
jgi:hypothetical protein